MEQFYAPEGFNKNFLLNSSDLFILNTSIKNISNNDFKILKNTLDLGYNFLFSDPQDVGQGIIELLNIDVNVGQFLNVKFFNKMSKLEFIDSKSLSFILDKYKIVIAPADKSLGFVILDKCVYINSIIKLLNDKKTYNSIEVELFNELNNNIVTECWNVCKLLKKGLFLNETQFEVLDRSIDSNKMVSRTIYGLPKIHKDPNSWDIPNSIPKIRPIIAGVNSHSYFFETVLCVILKPIADNLKYSLKSSLDVKNNLLKIKNFCNCTLYTLDVESLYPSIPIDKGISIVSGKITNYYKNKFNQVVIDNMILLLSLLLKNNTLTFNNKYFLQICGTAMGMSFAPAYANIFMDHIDILANHLESAPIIYIRYLDDILCVFNNNLNFNDFFISLNAIDSCIKFTVERCSKVVNFLDLTIDISNDHVIKYSLYQKNTNINNLVDYNSAHSFNTLLSNIQGYIFKIFVYNSCKEDIESQLINLNKKLIKKHYPQSVYDSQLKLVKNRLFVNDTFVTILGKIRCNNDSCKYCLCLNDNKGILFYPLSVDSQIIIKQNFNCQISNFTFVAECQICSVKIISHYNLGFRKFLGLCILSLKSDSKFHLLNTHLKSHNKEMSINLEHLQYFFKFHIFKHFSLKMKGDFSFYFNLKNNYFLEKDILWNDLSSFKNVSYVRSHYVMQSSVTSDLITKMKKTFKIKHINTYSNYKNQLKNILTKGLKKSC